MPHDVERGPSSHILGPKPEMMILVFELVMNNCEDAIDELVEIRRGLNDGEELDTHEVEPLLLLQMIASTSIDQVNIDHGLKIIQREIEPQDLIKGLPKAPEVEDAKDRLVEQKWLNSISKGMERISPHQKPISFDDKPFL